MNLNVWIIVSLILLVIAAIFVAVYLILTLIQIKKTAREMEETFQRLNIELGTVNRISEKVSDFADKLSAPVISGLSLLMFILNRSKRKKEMQGGEDE